MPDGVATAATAPIVLDAIGKRFDTSSGPVQAVDSVSLTVRREEFVSLLAPCAGPSPDKVALVFQDGGLFPWRTALDNVAFGLELRGVPAAKRREIARG